MKNKDKLLNYTLSVGFILIIVLFLTSIILISRYVLADENAFQQHVVTTKNLLDDIEKVEKSVENAEEVEFSQVSSIDKKKTHNYENNIVEHSYLNIKNDTSIISFKLNKNIKEVNNVLYLEYKNSSEIEANEIILYNLNQKGIVLSKNESVTIFNIQKQDTEKIKFENILGKIVLDSTQNSK